MSSIMIRNGEIIDSENGTRFCADIFIQDQKIVNIAAKIDENATFEIDASGCIVTPGLIDHHTHIYPMAKIGIPGEAVCFASGVTTAVDAGSTGCDNYEPNRSYIHTGRLAIKSYLNVCSTGLASLPEQMEDVCPEHMDEAKIRDVFERYGEELLGLKIRTSREIVGEMGYRPLSAAVDLAEKIGVPLMVHITNPPGNMGELVRILRAGDVVTHMYQNTGYSILEHNSVANMVWKARERGVLFEAADARAHFSFEVCEQALREGFVPDLLGTDITKFSMYLRPTAFNMAMQISKYHFLGIPFETLIQTATWKAAVDLKISDQVGSIRAGKQADIAIFKLQQQKNIFGDRPFENRLCNTREGSCVFEPMMTIKNGEVVYRNQLF